MARTLPPTTQLTPDELALLDKLEGFPQADIAQMVAIQLNQSGGVTGKVGWNYDEHTVADTYGALPDTTWSSYDTGLAQIDSASAPEPADVYQPGWIKKMQNPLANTEQALSMFESRHWQPWSIDPSFGPQHVNLLQGEEAAATVAGTSTAELRRKYPGSSFLNVAVPGTVPQAGGTGGSSGWSPWSLIAPGASALGSIGSDIVNGLLGGWVGQLWKLMASDALRALEVLGGGLLMGAGIVVLIKAMSAPDSQDLGSQIKGGFTAVAAAAV